MLLQDLRAVSVCPDGSDTRTALNFTHCPTTGQCLPCENGFLVLINAPSFPWLPAVGLAICESSVVQRLRRHPLDVVILIAFPVFRPVPGSTAISTLANGFGRPSSGDADNLRHTIRFLCAALSDDLGTRIYTFIANRCIRNPSDEQCSNMLAVPAKVAKQNVVGAFHRRPCVFPCYMADVALSLFYSSPRDFAPAMISRRSSRATAFADSPPIWVEFDP